MLRPELQRHGRADGAAFGVHPVACGRARVAQLSEDVSRALLSGGHVLCDRVGDSRLHVSQARAVQVLHVWQVAGPRPQRSVSSQERHGRHRAGRGCSCSSSGEDGCIQTRRNIIGG